MKRYLSILLIVITVFMLTACGSTEIKNGKTFTESDFEITLTNDFVKKELSGIKYYYEDSTNGILAIINVDNNGSYNEVINSNNIEANNKPKIRTKTENEIPFGHPEFKGDNVLIANYLDEIDNMFFSLAIIVYGYNRILTEHG